MIRRYTRAILTDNSYKKYLKLARNTLPECTRSKHFLQRALERNVLPLPAVRGMDLQKVDIDDRNVLLTVVLICDNYNRIIVANVTNKTLVTCWTGWYKISIDNQ